MSDPTSYPPESSLLPAHASPAPSAPRGGLTVPVASLAPIGTLPDLAPIPVAPERPPIAPAAPPVVRTEFVPLKKEDNHGPAYTVETFKRRMAIYGGVSVVMFVIVAIFIYNIFDIPARVFGRPFNMGWQGLLVYSSIASLILFLVVLLARYIGIMWLAYINTARYTARDEHESDFTPYISIIVPVYNEGMLLRATIDSLKKQNYPNYEIIIVDDGSSDNTREIARELVGDFGHVQVKLIEKPNGGKSTALNAGIQCAKSDFVLNVDGDSQLASDTLRLTIRHFEDPTMGAVAGNVKVVNRDNLWTRLQALEYVEGLNMARAAQSLVKLVNIIPGPLGLFRKQAILDAGWYTTDTFAEDCDLTLKMIRLGYRVEYEPDAISFTEAPNQLLDLLKQRYRWTRGILQAIRKHGDLFFNPTKSPGGTAVMWSMAFESLVWPIMNLFGNLYFITVAVLFGTSHFLVFWWLSLTILDMIAAMYCVAVEKEEAVLVFYAVFYRLFFILIIDVCKAMATIEEYLGLGMDWGKLDRIGALPGTAPS